MNIQPPGSQLLCHKMKIDDKFKEVKDIQQFRAKAGAGVVVFKVEAWSRRQSRSKMQRLRNTGRNYIYMTFYHPLNADAKNKQNNITMLQAD